jgi:rhamnulokinase
MLTPANFLAIDLGASSGRVLLGRLEDARLSIEELHRFENTPVAVLGSLHWDALRLWHEIKTGLTHYAHQLKEPLAGISVDTWGVDFALLDGSGKLLGNPYHYRDTRTVGVPERVVEAIGHEHLYARTGVQLMPINTLFQLYHMMEAQDRQLECAETLFMMPDLFHYWLTGVKRCEYTIASTSQMLHCRDRVWDQELLAGLGIPTRVLAPLVQPGTILGQLHPQVAREVGLHEDVPVIATGSHDTANAVAAVPDLHADSVYISSGTWSLMGVEVDEPVLNEHARALNFTNEGGVGGTIRLLRNVAGLWLLQECRRQWHREGHTFTWVELLGHAEHAEPFKAIIDPDAPDFLNPGDMPGAIRAFCRRTGQPELQSVGEVVRCCLESLALRYRWVLQALETLTGKRLERISIVGGGSQNGLLNQFTADACERPVIAGPVEATALGNIMLQAVARGYLTDVRAGRQALAASVERRRYAPRNSGMWQEAFSRFEALLDTPSS